MYLSREPMTDTQIAACAPSVFAKEPASNRSSKYQFVNSADVLAALRRAGFHVYGATQANVRRASAQGTQKHLLRFRRDDWQDHADATGAAPEVIMVNSHNGGCSYQMMAGMFRFACANGLISGSNFDTVRVRHQGEDTISAVIDGAYRVLDTHEKVKQAQLEMTNVHLSSGHQEAFAHAALVARYGADEDGKSMAPISPDRVLRPRRLADRTNDLWTVFNRVQEHLTRGGIRYYECDERGRRRIKSVRAVKGIDGNVKLNQALWTLAERMAEIAA